ncbi:unnamed protein product [Arctogadus glacialis]
MLSEEEEEEEEEERKERSLSPRHFNEGDLKAVRATAVSRTLKVMDKGKPALELEPETKGRVFRSLARLNAASQLSQGSLTP